MAWNILRRTKTAAICKSTPSLPMVVHVTHWKAGSQWIHRILHYCAAARIVTPKSDGVHFFDRPVKPDSVFPTVYLSKDEFDLGKPPGKLAPFVVIRDLRDTLISWYFSMKHSHMVDSPVVSTCRSKLRDCSLEDGLLWAIESQRFEKCAMIQSSWLGSGAPLLRYEDLLNNDVELLSKLFIETCPLGVSRELLHNAIRDCRFEKLAGRPPGVEDIESHFRKGVAGDYRRFFSDRVKKAFINRYGKLLVDTGYESSLAW